MNASSQDQHELDRIAYRAIWVVGIGLIGIIGGSVTTIVGIICGRMFNQNSVSTRGAPLWQAGQGWLPGWPSWALAITGAGVTLLAIGLVAVILMKRSTARLKAMNAQRPNVTSDN